MRANSHLGETIPLEASLGFTIVVGKWEVRQHTSVAEAILAYHVAPHLSGRSSMCQRFVFSIDIARHNILLI